MANPQTQSIASIFAAIKKKTGHKVDRLDNEFVRGWLVYTARCRYCNSEIELYTEGNLVAINKFIAGSFENNRWRINPLVTKMLLCKRLKVML